MKSLVKARRRGHPFAKAGMLLALMVGLAAVAPVHAVPTVPPVAPDAGPVSATSAAALRAYRHRHGASEVSRGPVKPPHHASRPLPPLPTQR